MDNITSTSISTDDSLLVVPKWEPPNNNNNPQIQNNGWTETDQTNLKFWLLQFLFLKRSKEKRLKQLKILMYVIIITGVFFSTLSGTLSAINIGSSENDSKSFSLLICSTITSFIASFFAGLIQVLKLNERIEKEKFALSKFNKLIRNLETCSQTPFSARKPPSEFFDQISNKIQQYETESSSFSNNTQLLNLKIKSLKKEFYKSKNQNHHDSNSNQDVHHLFYEALSNTNKTQNFVDYTNIPV